MKVVVCLDDKNGMLFNNRRQSRDRVLIADIMEEIGNTKLVISPFSRALFTQYSDKVTVMESFLSEAPQDSVCFAEDCSFSDFTEKISEVTVYKWNRVYPTDFKCDIDFSLFKVVGKNDFAGSSHEKITRIDYIKK